MPARTRPATNLKFSYLFSWLYFFKITLTIVSFNSNTIPQFLIFCGIPDALHINADIARTFLSIQGYRNKHADLFPAVFNTFLIDVFLKVNRSNISIYSANSTSLIGFSNRNMPNLGEKIRNGKYKWCFFVKSILKYTC